MSTPRTIRAAAQALRARAVEWLHQNGLEITPDALLEAAISIEGLAVISCAPRSSLLGEDKRAGIDRVRRRIVVDSSLTEEQRRFSLAHELGHWKLEGPAAECDGAVPEEAPAVEPLSDAYVTGYSPHQPHESKASLFAAEFLAPLEELRTAFSEQEVPASTLAHLYGVSQTVVYGQLMAAFLLPDDPPSKNEPKATFTYHPNQIHAYEAANGPTAIDAGPGTGKTRTLTARVEHLISKGVLPEHILCLTFTNKAAAEMRERIEEAIGPRAHLIRARTFHGFGLDLLRDYPEQSGVGNDVTLLDTTEICDLLEHNLLELGLEEYRNVGRPGLYLEAIVSAISRAKDEMVDPPQYAELAEEERARASMNDDKAQKAARRHAEVARVYAIYEEILARHGVVDYGDLIYRVVQMLRAHPEVAQEVGGERWPHIVVDEYQDVNRASAEMLKILHAHGESLWVVGDVRQGIFGFRGGASDNLRYFRTDFREAGEPIPLVRNYRSAPALLAVFSSIAKTMRDSKGFANWEAHRGEVQGTATFALAIDEAAELTGIADRIMEEPRRPLSHYAVLCHRNADVQLVANYLERRGIAVANFGNFMEREEVRDLLALLALHVEYGATTLLRITRMEAHHMDEQSAQALLKAVLEVEGGLPQVMRGDAPSGVDATAFARFQDDWTLLSPAAFQEEVWTFYAEYLFEDGRYLRRLLRECTPQARQRLLAVGQLVLLARAFDARQVAMKDDPPRGMERKRGFLRSIRRLWTMRDGRLPTPPGETEAVYVGTVHSSKGLEFPVVFVPFLVEGRFPFKPPYNFAPPPKGLTTEDDNASERDLEALFFVAATRARDHLFLSRAAIYEEGEEAKSSHLLRLVEPALAAGLVEQAAWSRSEVLSGPPPGRTTQAGSREEFRYSEIDAYQKCPRQFYYRHVLNLPEPEDTRAFLAYRTATQSVLDWIDERHREGSLPAEWEEMERVFASRWQERGLTEHVHGDFYREEALVFVRRMWEDRLQREPAPEWKRSVSGVIDGVRYTVPVEATRVEGSTLRVGHRYFRDRKPKEDHLEMRYTLLRHALATEAAGQAVVIEMHYPHESVELKPPRKDVDPRRIVKFGQITAGVAAGEFPAAPTKGRDEECPRCPYAWVCPC